VKLNGPLDQEGPVGVKSELTLKKAIVIASGSSLELSGVLDVLTRYEKKDVGILVTDRSLLDVIKKGITPDKFPFFYTCLNENIITKAGHDLLPDFFLHPEIYPITKEITLFYNQLLEKKRMEVLQMLGFQMRKFNRFGKGPGPGPEVKTAGNCGMALIEIGRHILKIDKVGFIGLDLDHSTCWKDKPDLNELVLSRTQLIEDLVNTGKSVYSLTRLGNLHGKGIEETTIHDFLTD